MRPPGSILISRWTSIYCNLDNKLKLVAPRLGVLGWNFKFRAQNSEGWSEFSPVLSIHHRSHPTLFDTPTMESTGASNSIGLFGTASLVSTLPVQLQLAQILSQQSQNQSQRTLSNLAPMFQHSAASLPNLPPVLVRKQI